MPIAPVLASRHGAGLRPATVCRPRSFGSCPTSPAAGRVAIRHFQDTRARSRAEDGWPIGQAGDRDAELRELPTFVHALGLAQVTISISLGRQDPSRLSCQLLSIQRLWKNRSVELVGTTQSTIARLGL